MVASPRIYFNSFVAVQPLAGQIPQRNKPCIKVDMSAARAKRSCIALQHQSTKGKENMLRRILPGVVVCLTVCFSFIPAFAFGEAQVKNLTIYDAGIAAVLEERTVELQSGLNTIEWRSLLPRAYIRTLRVVAENADVIRQDVSYDGAQIGNEKSPTLKLTIQNKGAAGARKVQVSYLVPNLRWQNDYAFVLEQTNEGVPPSNATLDSWVSAFNNVGRDVSAETVDLIAGEISLLVGDRQYSDYSTTQNITSQSGYRSDEEETTPAESYAETRGLSVFSRFRLGQNISLPSSAPVNRFPLFQRAQIKVIQRNVFENAYNQQTLARGGFILQPRGLEVRLLGKNTSGIVMPAGQVSIYAQSGGLVQLVGQDRVVLTPLNGEFTVSQGRSNTLFGTRKIVERTSTYYRNTDGDSRQKLTTKIEIVLTNKGKLDAEAFVRESVEPFSDNRWTILESSAQVEKLSENAFQMKVTVPAGGQTTVTYIVETK
jgi:hypothetical protein